MTATWRLLIDDGPAEGAWNMALDRAVQLAREVEHVSYKRLKESPACEGKEVDSTDRGTGDAVRENLLYGGKTDISRGTRRNAHQEEEHVKQQNRRRIAVEHQHQPARGMQDGRPDDYLLSAREHLIRKVTQKRTANDERKGKY